MILEGSFVLWVIKPTWWIKILVWKSNFPNHFFLTLCGYFCLHENKVLFSYKHILGKSMTKWKRGFVWRVSSFGTSSYWSDVCVDVTTQKIGYIVYPISFSLYLFSSLLLLNIAHWDNRGSAKKGSYNISPFLVDLLLPQCDKNITKCNWLDYIPKHI